MKYKNMKEASHGFGWKSKILPKLVYITITVKLYTFHVTSTALPGPL